jgi:hypothetical protein
MVSAIRAFLLSKDQMKKPLPALTSSQQTTAINKIVRAVGSKAFNKPSKPKRPSALDLKFSLKYRR